MWISPSFNFLFMSNRVFSGIFYFIKMILLSSMKFALLTIVLDTDKLNHKMNT